jgi:hypothetical protein
MRDFTETKLFGAGCVGLGAVGTCYLAGLDSESVIAFSLLAVFAYHLLYWERSLVGPSDSLIILGASAT